jgi:hypothetical protein
MDGCSSSKIANTRSNLRRERSRRLHPAMVRLSLSSADSASVSPLDSILSVRATTSLSKGATHSGQGPIPLQPCSASRFLDTGHGVCCAPCAVQSGFISSSDACGALADYHARE